jgi:hypothetical protein
MSLTEDGQGVADGVRGVMFGDAGPASMADGAAEVPDMIEDGVNARSIGRQELFPDAPDVPREIQVPGLSLRPAPERLATAVVAVPE